MTADLLAVGPTDRVGRARDLILSININALPVMDGNNVIGIITSSDLVDDWPEEEMVGNIMTRSPLAIGPETSLQEASEFMLERHVHHLLVEQGSETIGILSSLDLLAAFVSWSSGS